MIYYIFHIDHRPEENKFETLGEFKMYIDAGWELLFEYHNSGYGIEKSYDDDTYFIWACEKDEQVLDFEIDGVKIRDFITTDDVEITDRPGPM